MEPKQILMLTILILSAIIGSAVLVYKLETIDREDKGDGHDEHGHH
jgi:hypothetical protein